LTAAIGPSSAWQTAHGKPDNSGAVDVETAPAINPLPNAPRLGGVAPGAGPVIAPDGTVYVVNGRGKLMSFQPDGTPGWSRDVRQGVLSSPALGSDGSIYVIGAATIRDKRTDPPTTTHIAELHKFTAGGGYAWHVSLPRAPGWHMTTTAPANIVRTGGTDIIVVPTVRKFANIYQAWLSAFSADTGALLADQRVTGFASEVTGGTGGLGVAGWWCYLMTLGTLCPEFSAPLPGSPAEHTLPHDLRQPFPAVAVFSDGGAPLILMSDGIRDLVGFSFVGDALQERFRVRDDKHLLLSTPLAWPTGHAMISTTDQSGKSGVMFAGLNLSTIRAAGPVSAAAPTALGNSRFALVHRFGGVTVMRGASVEKSVSLNGESIASAAASRKHIYVSTVNALHTFDKASLEPLTSFAWKAGGVSQPAIGPSGHVYAIADDQLFVFKPPLSFEVVDTNGGGVFQDAGTPAPQPQSQTYRPPLTANNNRLFACEKLDGDDCGKGDYGTIAKAFCAKQGFTRADDIKVDGKKVKAETLDGRFCSKSKCKVFERIVCKM
jgi:hypothetical protein